MFAEIARKSQVWVRHCASNNVCAACQTSTDEKISRQFNVVMLKGFKRISRAGMLCAARNTSIVYTYFMHFPYDAEKSNVYIRRVVNVQLCNMQRPRDGLSVSPEQTPQGVKHRKRTVLSVSPETPSGLEVRQPPGTISPESSPEDLPVINALQPTPGNHTSPETGASQSVQELVHTYSVNQKAAAKAQAEAEVSVASAAQVSRARQLARVKARPSTRRVKETGAKTPNFVRQHWIMSDAAWKEKEWETTTEERAALRTLLKYEKSTQVNDAMGSAGIWPWQSLSDPFYRVVTKETPFLAACTLQTENTRANRKRFYNEVERALSQTGAKSKPVETKGVKKASYVLATRLFQQVLYEFDPTHNRVSDVSFCLLCMAGLVLKCSGELDAFCNLEQCNKPILDIVYDVTKEFAEWQPKIITWINDYFNWKDSQQPDGTVTQLFSDDESAGLDGVNPF